MGAMPNNGILGAVLHIPCRGLFMCPLAVVGLGLRYLRINFSLIFGQPVKKPCRVAFSIIENFGLQNDWCAIFTAFALVHTECVNAAVWSCSGFSCDIPT
jgi:hypothetical protein